MANSHIYTGGSSDGPLQGAADLVRKLKALGALDDGKIIAGAVRAGMKPALEAARNLIPVGTREHRSYKTKGGGGGFLLAPGHAKRSLRIVVVKRGDKQGATALLSTDKAGYYAVQFVERGTVKMKKEPWLRPAFNSTQQQQQAAIVAYLQKRILKIAKDGTP